jgi:hypothetical protein
LNRVERSGTVVRKRVRFLLLFLNKCMVASLVAQGVEHLLEETRLVAHVVHLGVHLLALTNTNASVRN